MVNIEKSWDEKLKEEFKKTYFNNIILTIREELKLGKIIYPNSKQVLTAFNTTPFYNVKVVIIGQDPYHNPGQAHGLSFSVPEGVDIPPSLRNIFKELNNDLNIEIPKHGNLINWAKQGVLLLNSSLTVEANKPMSHSKIGWHTFTDNVIKCLSNEREHLVFLLWGKFAQGKEVFIDRSKHLILMSAHPSPLSAHHGFIGNKHFSVTNQYLISNKIEPIDWSL